MNLEKNPPMAALAVCILLMAGAGAPIVSGQTGKVVSSYGPINQDTTFDQIKASRMAVKASRAQEHLQLLNSRYDLAKKTDSKDLMSGGKPIPVGPTAKLEGTSWDKLDRLAPDQLKEGGECA